MSARNVILGRIRRALADVPKVSPEDDVPIDWEYGQPLPTVDVVADLVEKIEDYKATVVQVKGEDVAKAITEALKVMGSAEVVIPDGLEPTWEQAIEATGLPVHRDEPQLTHEQLNGIDTVVTNCAVAMADSGTIALDHGPGQGRRALTLLPDRHVVVVRTDQIVSDVSEGITRLGRAVTDHRPITWISGGSATSDIELSRVEGVHGPRTLYVIIAN